jgi:hypothetical protein
MALTPNDVLILQVNASAKFSERMLTPEEGQFLRFTGANAIPTPTAIAISDVTSLTSTLTGKQAASSHLDNYVAAGAGIVKKDGSGNVTSLASTGYGEGLLNTADAAAARTYLGIGSVLGALNYQGTIVDQTAIDALPAAANGNKGYYYVISIAGATEELSFEGNTYGNGDWVVSNGTDWEKVNSSLNDGEVTTSKILNSAVTATKLATDSVTTIKIVDANVTEAKLATNSVSTAKIVDLNVTTAKLADSAVTDVKLATDAVTTSKILNAAVTDVKLATDSVTTAKIVDLNVTTAKLAANAVTTGKIAASAVTSTELADDAVITSKILDANVTAGKLATDSVTTAKIVDLNVTTAKLADASVTRAKLATGAIFETTAPATASSTGTAGMIAYDGDYFYVCVASNTWLKAALATWA